MATTVKYFHPGTFRIRNKFMDCMSFEDSPRKKGPRFSAKCTICSSQKSKWAIGEIKMHLAGVPEGQVKVGLCDAHKSPLWEGRNVTPNSIQNNFQHFLFNKYQQPNNQHPFHLYLIIIYIRYDR